MEPMNLERVVERARALRTQTTSPLATLLSAGEAVVARAPGRLDVMGGIADYSGSLVLQMPIREGTWVVAQVSSEPSIRVGSVGLTENEPDRYFEVPLSALREGELSTYESARHFFTTHPEAAWVAYVLGVFLVLQARQRLVLSCGINLFILSEVPEGKGVSSSAALEVAVLNAAAELLGISLDEREKALIAHEAENRVAGAPCGVMDQMASQCGHRGQLLRLFCQPAVIEGYVKIPEALSVYGLDSGVRHAVSGSDYGSVRVGAFMGYRVILGDDVAHHSEKYRGYLANVTVSEWLSGLREQVPERMNGSAFLERYGRHLDTVTEIDPSKSYAMRQPTEHPIYEHHRCRLFAALLERGESVENSRLLGELMFQSHTSYSACGLGSDATDLLVQLVREQGADRGLYGARITGGGSGGTVAVLARKDAESSIMDVVRRYTERTGRTPAVFRDTSDGAASFGQVSL